jgi:hypothetical protein
MLSRLFRCLVAALSLAMGALLALSTLAYGIGLLVDGDGRTGQWIAAAVLGVLSAGLVHYGRLQLAAAGRPVTVRVSTRSRGAGMALLAGLILGGGLVASLDEDRTVAASDVQPTSEPVTASATVLQHEADPVMPSTAVEQAVEPPASSAPVESQPVAATSHDEAPWPAEALDPRRIFTSLRSLGFEDGLGQRGWSRSRVDDSLWCAIALRTHGDNEVSCLMESDHPDRIGLVELEAEFYGPGDAAPLLADLAAAVQAAYPQATPELLAAIAQQRAWDGRDAHLRFEPHPSGRGHDLRFTWRP